jgi:hypothetical protein
MSTENMPMHGNIDQSYSYKVSQAKPAVYQFLFKVLSDLRTLLGVQGEPQEPAVTCWNFMLVRINPTRRPQVSGACASSEGPPTLPADVQATVHHSAEVENASKSPHACQVDVIGPHTPRRIQKRNDEPS